MERTFRIHTALEINPEVFTRHLRELYPDIRVEDITEGSEPGPEVADRLAAFELMRGLWAGDDSQPTLEELRKEMWEREEVDSETQS